jgi:DNA-3-methyladenine glycosylase I
MSTIKRCSWCGDDKLYQHYHDSEWGVPIYDDRQLFECLILEGAQAGLSWITVLRKREHYRKVFRQFDVAQLSRFEDHQLEAILLDPGIVRHRLKVFSVRSNAQAYLTVQQEFGSFSNYAWAFVGGEPLRNRPRALEQVPAATALSTALSKDLKKRGFTFIGPTIIYAFMQATGMVDDHAYDCDFASDPLE